MKDIIELTRMQVSKLIDDAPETTYAIIETTRDMAAIVDAEFRNQVQRFRWYAIDSGLGHIYAVADIDGRRISLQRYVTFLKDEREALENIKYISFKNKVSFDSRLANLEFRTDRQSMMRNRKPKKNTSSVYKGVIRHKKTDGTIHWRGQIHDGVSTIGLGVFEEEEWAAQVYDAAAFYLFEGAGYYNFPDDCPNVDALKHAIARIKRFRARKAIRDKRTKEA